MNELDIRTKEYELAFLVENEAIQTEVEAFFTELQSKFKVESLEKDTPKFVNLAYPIKKHKSAIMLVYRFVTDTKATIFINDTLRYKSGVLRYMLVSPAIRVTSNFKKNTKSSNNSSKEGDVVENNSSNEEVKTKKITRKKKEVEVPTNSDLQKTLEEVESK